MRLTLLPLTPENPPSCGSEAFSSFLLIMLLTAWREAGIGLCYGWVSMPDSKTKEH